MKLRNAIVAPVVVLLLFGCRDELKDFEEAAVPVRVVETTRGPFTPKLLLFGTVRPSRTYALLAGPGGTITYPRRFATGLRTGEHVSRGEEVAWIENEDARLALAEARLAVELATAQLARTRTSVEQGLSAKVELERDELQLKVASERLTAAEVRAAKRSIRVPDDGLLIVDHVIAPESEVSSGKELAQVALQGLPRVEAVAAAGDRTRLEPGLVVHINARDGSSVEGRIVEVSGTVDESGTIRVVAEPSSEEGLPAPGEGVELVVELNTMHEVVAVPEAALVFGSSNQAAVFVVDALRYGENLAVARRVDVVVGGRSGDRVAVVSGLTNGELVVTAGAAMLGERTTVKVAKQEDEP